MLVLYVVGACAATFTAFTLFFRVWSEAARWLRKRGLPAYLGVLATLGAAACDNSVEIDGCGDLPCPGVDAGAGGAATDAGMVDADASPPTCDFQSPPPQDPKCPSYPNAIVTTCYDGGPCQLVACIPNFADCDRQVQDGCEVDVQNDPLNCGTCGHACPNGAACVNLVCQ